jgi:ribosomal protein S18 acetylase RimI-like enzyme
MYVRPAERPEYHRIIRLLGQAFRSDPGLRWILPDDTAWERFSPWIFQWYVSPVTGSDCVLATGDLAATAVWHPPGAVRRGLITQLVESYRWCRLAGRRLPEIRRYGALVADAHPSENHWYLAALATSPDRQGQGLGSLLLRNGLARCDAERVPAYLETTRESNVSLYLRFGFRLNGELTSPPYPHTWFMFRPCGGAAGRS